MRPTVVLFDIDGTLIHGDGAGRVAMEAAFTDVFGDAAPLRVMQFAGMTDPAIVRQGIAALNGSAVVDDAQVHAVLDRYVARLPGTIAAAPGYRLLAGVAELLRQLIDGPELAVGLGTGNLERSARLKLMPVAVADRFTFGGYGSDAEDRSELLAVGAARGAARLGYPATQCRVVIVGDTPRDVQAALAIGADCLAVATSFYDVQQLTAVGATWVAEDLTDPRALSWILDMGG